MSNTTPIERAERDLKSLLESLDPGETVTLVDSGGEPLAVLISLKSASATKMSSSEWLERWGSLAQRVSRAWQGDESAIETLAEMRR